MGFIYDLRYYEDHSYTDTSYQFNGSLHHSFSERYSLTVSDSVVASQDPGVNATFNAGLGAIPVSTPLRVSGNNVHNNGTVTGTAELTQLVDLKMTYANDLYDYGQTFGDVLQPRAWA